PPLVLRLLFERQVYQAKLSVISSLFPVRQSITDNRELTLGNSLRDTVQSKAMTHWKLTLAYDGTPFHGWQIQPGLPTVQGTLSDALERITGERALPQGSGRTDAGVHALAQVASFALKGSVP